MNFHAYARTQFGRPILAFQSDNGREFDNQALRSFYSHNGILLRLSFPCTSPQNSKAERILRTLNDGTRVLLLHAGMPSKFWVEALQTSTFLLNRRPCKPKLLDTPFHLLYNRSPDYSWLRIFSVYVTLTPRPRAPTSLLPARLLVSSLVFHRITEAIGATTWLHAGSLSLGTSTSTTRASSRSGRLQQRRPLLHLRTTHGRMSRHASGRHPRRGPRHGLGPPNGPRDPRLQQ
jgi:transposase InsO family protein